MAFEDFVPVRRMPPNFHPVKASLRKRRDGCALFITLTSAKGEELELTDGARFRVAIGNGEDHGRILFTPDAKGPVSINLRHAAHNSTYFAFDLGHVARFVNRHETAKGCELKVRDKGAFIVTLPSWAQETSPEGLARQAQRDRIAHGNSPAGKKEMIARAAAAVPSGLSEA